MTGVHVSLRRAGPAPREVRDAAWRRRGRAALLATFVFGLMASLYGSRAGGVFVLSLVAMTLCAVVALTAAIEQRLP
jgi:hypothetical protein